MNTLIIYWINRIMVWTVGKPFWTAVLAAVSKLDGRYDLDGDGKKSGVIEELVGLGFKAGQDYGKRQINRAIENALIVVERRKA
jgi:hypothetical protein